MFSTPSPSRRSLSSKISPSSYTPKKSNKKEENPKPQEEKEQKSKEPYDRFRKEREKLCHTLDTYTLLIRSCQPMRCLEHNSNISVYCETEQRLLCANCIFGRNEHKYHRVIPVDKSHDKIVKDIETMQRIIDREIATVARIERTLAEAVLAEEKYIQNALNDLAQRHSECHRMLDLLFIHSKENLVCKLDKIRLKYETLSLETRFLQDVYKVENIMKNVPVEGNTKEQNLLYEHVVCHKIASLKKIEDKEWVTDKLYIKEAGVVEMKKIECIVEAINYYSKIT